jgi:hypothetical protein
MSQGDDGYLVLADWEGRLYKIPQDVLRRYRATRTPQRPARSDRAGNGVASGHVTLADWDGAMYVVPRPLLAEFRYTDVGSGGGGRVQPPRCGR